MVLCITHSNDFYTIDIVQQHLDKSGIPSFRLNTDEFATGYRLNYQPGANQTDGPSCYLSTLQEKIRASEINAVWYRKMWDLQVPDELDPAYRPVFLREYQTYLQLFFNALRHVPWMNNMEADRRIGGDKLQQLLVARSTGLKIPATIFTNDAGVIRDFFKKCRSGMIMKLHGALSKSMEGNAPFFPTTKLSEDDLAHLDTLAYCPMIFQEYISKAYELRIAYVDGAFFTGKIPHEEDKTDWRVAAGRPFRWQPYELPGGLRENISRLMHELGLTFGAIDMIRHTDGSYVFLEVNPQGEWGMLQKHLGYPIGETIAEKLVNSKQ